MTNDYDYRSLIAVEPHDPVAAPVQVEPTDAPRFTAVSHLRSLSAETLDLLPPAQNVVNTTPPAPVGGWVQKQAVPDDDRAPALIITISREADHV